MHTKNLKVLMLATYFPKPLNHIMGNWALAQAQALRRNGIDVMVVSLTSWVPSALALTKGARAYSDCPERFDWNGVTALYPRWLNYPVGPARWLNQRYPRVTTGIGWLSARSKLLSAVESFHPHLIYAHHTAVNGYLAMRLKRETNLPFLVTDHDFGEIEDCRIYSDRRKAFVSVVRESSAMIAVSTRMEREMKDQFPLACTHTIHNGANPVPQKNLDSLKPAALLGKLVIFSCGAFYHRKGFPLLIEAFALIAQKYPEAVLRIAGDGEERAEIELRIINNKLESQVVLLGSIPHDDVIQEMVWCDVFALVGWDEPFATVYLEALAAGKPVVCCSDGGIADVIKNGEHGFTVPPRNVKDAANALDRLLSDEELRKAMGVAALHLFQTALTWDRHALRMKDLFSKALAQ